MAETVKMLNREMMRMRNALGILGNRRMANLNGDLKVARLLRALALYVEPVEETKRKALLDVVGKLPENAELTPTQEQVLAVTVAEAQAGVDRAEVEMILPMECVLREADLPKEQTGPEGWKNASQLGAIVSDLGPLYLMSE